MTIRLLVVDDSGFFQKRMREILKDVPDIKVVGFASNGREALEAVAKLKPDVITLDYEMPVMDGLTCLRELMRTNPTPVLMFSSLSYEGARVTLDALEAGAVDYLPKNFEDLQRGTAAIKRQLIEKIKTVASSKMGTSRSDGPTPSVSSTGSGASQTRQAPSSQAAPRAPVAPSKPDRPAPTPATAPRVQPTTKAASSSTTAPSTTAPSTTAPVARSHKTYSIVVIGTSTGGPVALQRVLVEIPASFPLPIILVQHMPGTFTTPFAERLDKLSALSIKEAEEGDVLAPGKAFLAPGGMQLMLDKNKIHIVKGDERLSYKPSVDIAFASAAKHYPGKTLAMVLTGMGADGREGARLLKSTGSTVWTQDEASCVIYGMPMAVEKAGLSDEVIPLGKIAKRLLQEIG
jgi:two-component system chemotaxis response regulator CheB